MPCQAMQCYTTQTPNAIDFYPNQMKTEYIRIYEFIIHHHHRHHHLKIAPNFDFITVSHFDQMGNERTLSTCRNGFRRGKL